MWPLSFSALGLRQTHRISGALPAPSVATSTRRAPTNSGVCGFECGPYCYGVAEPSMLGQIAALVERLYGRRGYRMATVARRAGSPRRIALAGSHEGRLFATLTLGLDGPDGLLVDDLYRPEVDVFRRRQRRICELSTFAIDPQYSSHDVLASLFFLAYLYGRTLHQVTDAVIEVNPRHAAFYERIFHFRRIGEVRHCPRVDAPAVLLHLDLEAGSGCAQRRAENLSRSVWPST
jgi:hypothetical protein